MTRKQLFNALKNHKYIAVRWWDGAVTGANCKIAEALLLLKNFESMDNKEEPVKVAILYDDTPVKEPQEDQDVDTAASEYGGSFKTGAFFERIRVEAFKAGVEWAKRSL